jgi:uncharacterized protein YkwD
LESGTFQRPEIQAHAMKWLIATLVSLTTVSGLSVAASPPAQTATNIEVQPPQPSPNISTAAADEDIPAETALLESVNRSRQQAGVAPLRMDESLRQAARLHARRMVATRRLEHQFAGEPSLLQRIADVSSLPLDRAGENIADVSCPGDAHDLLMHSPPHRQNILDPRFNVMGIVAIWGHGRLYVVQDFGHAMPSYSARETARRVGEALNQARASAGLSELAPFAPPHLDEAACALAKEDRPNARIVAASYTNRKVITYTQSTPEVLPPAASGVLENPNLHKFAVGSCYARNAAYPTGIYWVAILLY